MATVSIIKAAYSDPAIETLLEPLGGMKQFVNKHERVLLKVNLLSSKGPDRAVTTHPEFVRAVAKAVRKAGGEPYIGDSPAGTFSNRTLTKTYGSSGLANLADEDGIELNFNTGVRKLDIPHGKRLHRAPICDYALKADKVFALPKLKTHSIQYLTLACKIMYGAVPGLTKAKYHAQFPRRAAFADMLLDILTVVKTQLYIMDGIVAMQGQGPGSGDPVKLDLVLASTDPVAMDIAVCKILGIEHGANPINRSPDNNSESMPICRPAHPAGLGESTKRGEMFKQRAAKAAARKLIFSVLLIAFISFDHGGLTAASDGFKRPGYSPVLRQNEDWSALAGLEDADAKNFFDPIKYIPLSDHGDFRMSFGGQVRFRVEGWNNFDFNREFDDTFLLSRFRLHTDIHTGKYFRWFAEMKSAFSTDRDLPGGRRTLDVDELALQQAFVDIMLPVGESAKLTLRPGRQMLLHGKQRLVSPLDWSNTMRTWQGFQGFIDYNQWKISGFWTQFVPVKKYEHNEADADEPFGGIYATGKPGNAGIGLDGYWLYRKRKLLDDERHTVGGRIFGTIGQKRLDYDFEAAYQTGDAGNKDVRAFMVGSQFGYRFTEAAYKPRVYVGFDYGSGDKDPDDGKVGTFDQLYPLGHLYLGYIDVVARQNIISPNIGFTFSPIDKLTFETTGLFFWRAREKDALYNAGGAALRQGAPGTSLEVGQEIDILLRYAYKPHTVLLLGYSHFFPGDFISETGTDDPIDFLYTSLEYTF